MAVTCARVTVASFMCFAPSHVFPHGRQHVHEQSHQVSIALVWIWDVLCTTHVKLSTKQLDNCDWGAVCWVLRCWHVLDSSSCFVPLNGFVPQRGCTTLLMLDAYIGLL